MSSLTPRSRSDEVTKAAMKEGFVNAGIVSVPTLGAMYAGLKNPWFRKVTNVQSRTALVAMPVLFAFAAAGENKLTDRMGQIAKETEDQVEPVDWAKEAKTASPEEIKIHDTYRQSIMDSGVRLVPELNMYHRTANYVQQHPFKCIAGFGIPAVAGIYLAENSKNYLSQELKILHTRVYGQAAVIGTLLGIMSFKEIMDDRGRYLTEQQVEERVAEMRMTRNRMMDTIEHEYQKLPNHDD
eukprot:scaffold22578_cov164-Cylindrotheca_fusiformis.AAC.2